MPWERERYPENWSEIASALKETVGWCCQVCGQPCRKQGETLSAFIQRLFPEPESKAARDAAKHPKRYTLTIGHLDQLC